MNLKKIATWIAYDNSLDKCVNRHYSKLDYRNKVIEMRKLNKDDNSGLIVAYLVILAGVGTATLCLVMLILDLMK